MTSTSSHNQAPLDDCLFCMEHLHEAALGILEQEDRPRLEHHLADCNVCRSELHELDATVNLLPLAVDQSSPHPETRSSLLQRMETELRSPQESLTNTGKMAEPSQVAGIKVTPSAFLPQRSFWTAGNIAAGLAIAFIAIAAWNFLPVGNNGDPMPQGQMRVLAMESSTTCADCHENTSGHIGANLDSTDGTVIVWNLDPAQKHEVWCVNRNGERKMVGELQVDPTGTAMQTLSFPEEVGGYDQIYVARNDGTEELTVAPNKVKTDHDPPASPPA